MQTIWEVDEGNIKALLDRLPDPRPPYTTSASTIKNLEKKSYVTRRLLSNTYLYTPIVSVEQNKYQFI